jgi:hypothetical protein
MTSSILRNLNFPEIMNKKDCAYLLRHIHQFIWENLHIVKKQQEEKKKNTQHLHHRQQNITILWHQNNHQRKNTKHRFRET